MKMSMTLFVLIICLVTVRKYVTSFRSWKGSNTDSQIFRLSALREVSSRRLQRFPLKQLSSQNGIRKFNSALQQNAFTTIRAIRTPLEQLRIGQHYNGTVKNLIEHFGFFVDIGSKVDGFVHIGDISHKYFTKAIQNRVRVGDSIKVWVKDVDVVRARIRLQMFPIKATSHLRWSELQPRMEVNGTVTKIAEEALYVDIGTPLLAYLPRRNMRIPKGKGSLRVHEIAPYNSTIRCYIREANEKQRKLVVTTYSPDNWHIYLPPLSQEDLVMASVSRRYKGRFAEQEEIKRQKQQEREAFKRRMRGEIENAKTFDFNNYDEVGDSGFASVKIEHTEDYDNIRKTGNILIDDLQANSSLAHSNRTTERKMRALAYEANLTTKELFRMLCGSSKDYITFKDFKHWWYVRMLKQVGDWDGRKFKEAMAEASGGYLRIYESQLDRFLIIFARKFNISTGSHHDDSNIEFDQSSHDFEDYDEDDEYNEEFPQQNFEVSNSSTNIEIENIDNLSIDDSKWLLLQEIRGHALSHDIGCELNRMLPTSNNMSISWDQISQLRVFRLASQAQIITHAELKTMFSDTCGNTLNLNESEFNRFVAILMRTVKERIMPSLFQQSMSFPPPLRSLEPSINGNFELIPMEGNSGNTSMNIAKMSDQMLTRKLPSRNTSMNFNISGNGLEENQYNPFILKIFDKLRDGKDYVHFNDLLSFEMVQDLIFMGKLDPDYLHEIVKMFKELSNDGTEIPTQSVLEGELKYPTFYGVLKTLMSILDACVSINVKEDNECVDYNELDIDSLFDRLSSVGGDTLSFQDVLQNDWFHQFGISSQEIKMHWQADPSRNGLDRDQFAEFCAQLFTTKGYDIEKTTPIPHRI